MLLEAAHTSDPSFDPATVLFKPIIQVDARPVVNVSAQRRADCARVGAMPVGVVRSGTKPTTTVPSGRTSGRAYVTGRAQHRVDQVPVAIDRPKQTAPGAPRRYSYRHRGAGLPSTVATPRELHFPLV